MWVLKVKVISWPWPKVIYIWKLKLAFLRNDWAILNQMAQISGERFTGTFVLWFVNCYENAFIVFGAVLDQIVGYWKIKICWVETASECVCITPPDIFLFLKGKIYNEGYKPHWRRDA